LTKGALVDGIFIGPATGKGMSREEPYRLDTTISPRVTAAQLVRGTLRAAIVRGDLPGGTRLVQTEIANQLGVSTTPVREAMRDLASEGLIVLDNHRIGTVRKPDWDEMVEIVEIRRSLEAVAVRRSMANITEEEMEQARVLADELAEEQEIGSWVEANIKFHSIFHRATRTTRLSSILSTLQEGAGVFVAQAQSLHPEIRKQAVDEHYALIDAYKANDVETAVKIGLRHVSHPLTAYEMGSSSR
jgi:DNA-binding GntR family transcriptional regulator